ncbi:polysaccharide deacetylase family protein [Catellatospora tritici]|uniref:polysaccharide deacetylase family protein n=1 Tax=Catellatospora tritici TaxID=2851566 RepID=UPI001C2D134B|nr:polysaccharide deacetylase family protein [Catellatospora tritici]MBV1852035.1 polysaccharide deacetylase family protein [Catellatospora tritici]
MAQRRSHGLITAVISLTLALSACTGGRDDNTAAPRESPSAAIPSPSPSASPSATPTVKPSPIPEKMNLQRTTGIGGVALTFDDGPSAWTPKVLDALKARGVKATFCVIGSQAAAHPDLIRRIVAEGHTLCNHSWNHEFKLGTWSTAKVRANLQRTNDAIHAAVPGVPIKYFRHPGGNWTLTATRVARSMGMSPLHWAVDPQDWRRPGAGTIANRVIRATRSGSVVLMHDGGGDRSQTLAALPRIITTLRAKYRLVRLPDAL